MCVSVCTVHGYTQSPRALQPLSCSQAVVGCLVWMPEPNSGPLLEQSTLLLMSHLFNPSKFYLGTNSSFSQKAMLRCPVHLKQRQGWGQNWLRGTSGRAGEGRAGQCIWKCWGCLAVLCCPGKKWHLLPNVMYGISCMTTSSCSAPYNFTLMSVFILETPAMTYID